MAKILIKEIGNTLTPNREDIICLGAKSRYTYVYWYDRKNPEKPVVKCATKSLKEFEAELDGADFMRINRSTIVAIDFIDAISDKGWVSLQYECKVNLKVSASKRATLMEKLRNRTKQTNTPSFCCRNAGS